MRFSYTYVSYPERCPRHVPTLSTPATVSLPRCCRAPRSSAVLLTLQSYSGTCTARSCPSLSDLCAAPTPPSHAGDPSGHWPPSDGRICADIGIICASRNSAATGNQDTLPRISTIHSRHQPIHRPYPRWIQEKLPVERDVPPREELGGKRGFRRAARGSCP
jgi:hypothetical protein